MVEINRIRFDCGATSFYNSICKTLNINDCAGLEFVYIGNVADMLAGEMKCFRITYLNKTFYVALTNKLIRNLFEELPSLQTRYQVKLDGNQHTFTKTTLEYGVETIYSSFMDKLAKLTNHRSDYIKITFNRDKVTFSHGAFKTDISKNDYERIKKLINRADGKRIYLNVKDLSSMYDIFVL